MRNKKMWLAILAMVLVFGMTVVGCDDGSIDDVSDLNGTYIGRNSSGDYYGETTLNNGTYEFSGPSGPTERGTYTVNGNTITFTQTWASGGSGLNPPYTAVYYPNEKKYVFDSGNTFTRK